MGAKLTRGGREMVNFMGQLGWATVPIYLSNIILDVSGFG